MPPAESASRLQATTWMHSLFSARGWPSDFMFITLMTRLSVCMPISNSHLDNLSKI
jgi:hypothetical protein